MPCAFMILLFATVAAAPTVPAQLDAILKDYGRADAPGASVLVAQGGKVLYRKAFGLANLEERTPITTATNFRLAAVTKQFTATAVLLLAAPNRCHANVSGQGFPTMNSPKTRRRSRTI